MSEEALFILAGNGPYANRGCEAIVRGTVKILKEHFDKPRFICLSHFPPHTNLFNEQRMRERDQSIIHISSNLIDKKKAIMQFWKPETWKYIFAHYFKPDTLKEIIYQDIIPQISNATGILSIGGDNYATDFTLPTLFTDFDDIVLSQNKPLTIWGASIGPFHSIPEYERYMAGHLKKTTAIFARESMTIKYLKTLGITENVYPVADPAFQMEPVKPEGIEEQFHIEKESIGINLSPLIAKFATGGDLNLWVKKAASIIEAVALKNEQPICLIPHVTLPNSNDYEFMMRALSMVGKVKKEIYIVPPIFDAAETKWIISQMTFFVGARTHSTIASLSSGTPTLSLSYSMKSQGINRDIFGHDSYVIASRDIESNSVAEKVRDMIEHTNSIRDELMVALPQVRKMSYLAGQYQKEVLETFSPV